MYATGGCRPTRPAPRRGAAAGELVVLGALLAFVLLASTDFARAFYSYLTITNCAYDGAVYGSQTSTYAADSTGIQKAAVKDGANLSPAVATTDVSSSQGTDANGDPTVAVTVTHSFSTLVAYPGIPSSISLSRTVTMRVLPNVPGTQN